MWVKRTHPDKPDAEVCTQIQLPESFIMNVGFTGERKDENVSNTIDFNCDYGDSDPTIQMYGDMPADEEYNTYRGNGTYVDSEGLIKPSHLAKRALQTWEDSLAQAKADGTRFVLGVPSSLDLRSAASASTATLSELKSETQSKVNEWFATSVAAMANSTHTMPETDPLVDVHVPKGSKAALTQAKFFPLWPEAVYKEINGLIDMDCIELFNERDPRVQKCEVLPSHIVFTDKWTADVPAEFIKAKARVVAGGNFEAAPEKAFENFSPTAG
jgi:hypothetical protein